MAITSKNSDDPLTKLAISSLERKRKKLIEISNSLTNHLYSTYIYDSVDELRSAKDWAHSLHNLSRVLVEGFTELQKRARLRESDIKLIINKAEEK